MVQSIRMKNKPKDYSSAPAHKSTFGTEKYDYDQMTQQKIRQEIQLLETRLTLERDTYKTQDIEEMATDDIESDEPNIFERNIKFNELHKRFENHREYSLRFMKGNDYKFNVYLRKMGKLSHKRFGGIDLEGYRDYINNLTKFKKIETDWLKDDLSFKDEQFENFVHPTSLDQYAEASVDALNDISQKQMQLKLLKDSVIKLLKEEIELQDQLSEESAKNEDLKSSFNTYKANRQQDGYDDTVIIEKNLMDQHKDAQDPSINRLHINNLAFVNSKAASNDQFSDNRDNEDEYLAQFDEQEEEILSKIIKFLHEHPYLFRKIRFLQRNNKIPELSRLHRIKSEIISKQNRIRNSSKKRRGPPKEVPEWVKDTDEDFQKMYEKRGIKALNQKSGLVRDNLADVSSYEITQAMNILIEGYKRAKIENKPVVLEDILNLIPEQTLKNIRHERLVKQSQKENKKVDLTDEAISKLYPDVPTFEESKKTVERLKESAAEFEEYDDYEGEQANMVQQESGPNSELEEEFEKMKKQAKEYMHNASGKYLPGYRHYENYRLYNVKYPDRTIEDYKNEMRREATFSDFKAAYSIGMKLYSRLEPMTRMEIAATAKGNYDQVDQIINSNEFEKVLKKQYTKRLREFYQKKRLYTFVDLMEEFLLWDFDIDSGEPLEMKNATLYDNTDKILIPFYQFSKQLDRPDPLGSMKIGPSEYLNPFKAAPEHPEERRQGRPVERIVHPKRSRYGVSYLISIIFM